MSDVFQHRSGVLATYDRAPSAPDRARVVWPEGRFIQGADLNEGFSLAARQTRRVGDMVAADGDRVDGAEIVVDIATGICRMTAGRIYVRGTVLPVSAGELTGVPMSGDVKVGVKLQRTTVTHEEDPSLLGLHPGTWAEGEPGAIREHETLVWALRTDAQPGDFFSVYLLRNGAVIDQKPPAALTGVLQHLAGYDYSANGHYIVDGLEVEALGRINGEQVFSIGAGEANIQGWKRVRETSLRLAVPEEPDLEAIAAEPHTYVDDAGSAVLTVLRPPIAAVTQAVVVKQVSEGVVRGSPSGTADALGQSSVVSVLSVTQGGTTYVEGDDYTLVGNTISWAPGGAEPATGSTYTVVYRYNEAVTPDAVTDTTVTVSGGVDGTTALLSYTSKLPRVDLICMERLGTAKYIKGVSARFGAIPPRAPSTLLKIAEVWNDWMNAPRIENNGVRNFTYETMRRYFRRLVTLLNQFDRTELERDVLARAPVAREGIFTDAFVDDFFRDQGAVQTAAINRGVCQLPIEPILIQRVGTQAILPAFEEEILIEQTAATSSMLINPYMNLVRMPAAMTLAPNVDFWTERVTEWTSPITQEFTTAPNVPPGQESFDTVVSETRREAQLLRQISVDFTIEGFGVGENLSALTFDGIDVNPGGLSGDANGDVTGTFTIPAGVPVGRRRVRAEGAAGSFAEAIFVGEGTIDVTVMRRVTLVARAGAPPPPAPAPNAPFEQWNANIADPWGNEANMLDGGDADPLAQTFIMPDGRYLAGVDIIFTAIGDADKGVRIQISSTLNGYPTSEVLAEAFIPMQGVTIGEWTEARFTAPVFLPAGVEFAFVVMTDDPDHAVAISRLGDVVDLGGGEQEFVASQPYVIGVLFSSANRRAWTPHQDADMAFRLIAAKFTETERTVDLWTGAFDQISDVIVRGGVDIPTDAAAFRYELVRADNSVIRMSPGQTHEFAEYVTETVTLRAVLTGTERSAPMLLPGTQIIAGRLGGTGTYITRAFTMGTDVDVRALFAARIPSGASVTVEVDAADDNWQAMTLGTIGILGGGWTEPQYARDPHTATVGRVRVTLTGTPAARPSIARLRAYTI